MRIINLIIGTLPYFLVLYHLCFLLNDFQYHMSILLRLIGNCICSKLLKLIFSIKRVRIINRDRFYFLRKIINKFDSGHSFPSSHVMFYTTYYFHEVNIYRVCLILFMCYGRVYYGHHTVKDVVAGVVFGVMYNVAIVHFFN